MWWLFYNAFFLLFCLFSNLFGLLLFYFIRLLLVSHLVFLCLFHDHIKYQISTYLISWFCFCVHQVVCPCVRVYVCVCLCACVPACRFVRVRHQVATIWCLGILSNLFNIIWCSKYPWEIAIQFNCTPLYVLLNPTSPFFFCSKEN